jgi:hypothetical protein
MTTINYDLEVNKSSKTSDENKQTQCPISIIILILFLPEEQLGQDRKPSNTSTFSTGKKSTFI